MPVQGGLVVNDPRSFERRLRRIQKNPNKAKRGKSLRRLLGMFDAETVRTQAGTIVGYRLPTGEWFCRKIAYPTEEAALVVAKRIEKHRHILCTPYTCRQCGHIHLTSAPNGKRYAHDTH